jgi:hypothetical protein
MKIRFSKLLFAFMVWVSGTIFRHPSSILLGSLWRACGQSINPVDISQLNMFSRLPKIDTRHLPVVLVVVTVAVAVVIFVVRMIVVSAIFVVVSAIFVVVSAIFVVVSAKKP